MTCNVVFCQNTIERDAAIDIYKRSGRPVFWFGPCDVASAERLSNQTINQIVDVGPDAYVVVAGEPGQGPSNG